MYSWVFLELFLVILRRKYILLTLLICTAELLWKCPLSFWRDSTHCTHYYSVQLNYSENDLSYTEETVHTAHITTMYSWVILKMSLVILRRQYVLLTLILCTAELFWKCCYLFGADCTYCLYYKYIQLSFSEKFLSYSEETVVTAHITNI